jgi:hypothetical protein
LNRLIREAAFSLGYNLTPKIADADVLKLISNLRPRHCGHPLIRIGAERDGGYLIPDDLQGIEYCFSPGVSALSAFENQLADRGIRSFLADHSVAGPPHPRCEFVFDRKHIGANDSDIHMTLATWKERYLSGYRADLLLQMDIEGAEYETILGTPDEVLRQFRILVIEMHWLERLFDPFAFRIMNACFEKLLARFYVVHLHPNNCGGCVREDGIEVPHVMEMTFYNRDRAAPGDYCTQFPHPHDADNCPGLPTLPLPTCWREPRISPTGVR